MKTSIIKFKELFDRTHQQMMKHSSSRMSSNSNLNKHEEIRSSCRQMLSINSSFLGESKTSKGLRARPKTARSYSKMSSKKDKTSKKDEIITHRFISQDFEKTQRYKQNSQLIRILKIEVINCLKSRTKTEIIEICQQFAIIRELFDILLTYQKQQSFQHHFESFQASISNTITHRISRILYYFTYNKYLQSIASQKKTREQLKKMSLCQYYARHLNLPRITIQACKRILHILIELRQYDESRVYARKCLRIAVYINDPSIQFEIIEKFKLISYYQGHLNKYEQISISNQERENIKKTFSMMDDLPEMPGIQIQEKFKLKPLQIIYDAEDMGNTNGLQLINKNVTSFITNLAHMQKQLTDHSKGIKNTIRKVGNIGKVKKYIGEGNYIMLCPRSRKIVPQHQSQVLVTNLKTCNKQQKHFHRFYKEYLPKYYNLVGDLMGYCEQHCSSMNKV